MLTPLTIPKSAIAEPGLNQAALYAIGLAHAQEIAGRIWTDYNVHDPGVTTLELLSYALTDLSYRAALPVQDILASKVDNAKAMADQFFSARRILPNRPLTVLDYRKLLIDLEGVKNAWLKLSSLSYYANTNKGTLSRVPTNAAGEKEVQLKGLYDVLIDFTDQINTNAERSTVLDLVKETLMSNRNLCEDFVNFTGVETQDFRLCCELELAPDADVNGLAAQILFQVQEYMAPAVPNYTLTEMLSRTHPDKKLFTADEIFNGPELNCGFIDSDELTQAELRTEIHLSDVIQIIMGISGVRAIRDIVLSPAPPVGPPADKWVVPVAAGMKALLDREKSRLVFYKRNMPVAAMPDEVDSKYIALSEAARAKTETAPSQPYDLPIPLGQDRELAEYYSFQNHFPALYGLSDQGLGEAADARRKALAFQLKGYLLFFDQIMANYFAQLSRVKDLLSFNPDLEATYFSQVVDSFADYEKIYQTHPNQLASLTGVTENDAAFAERRNRFLDHLIARFAEQFTDYVHIVSSAFGSTSDNLIPVRCDFLRNYPAISSDRALAYNYWLKESEDLWDSANVSGLERRLASLLGLSDFTRRDLKDSEGMYLIEMILLRPETDDDDNLLLPICPDPNCVDCAGEDPYSYRIHIVLPAYSSRFSNMDFRRFCEEVIRTETPAHILPRVCWISQDDMGALEKQYRDWISLKAGADETDRAAKMKAFIDILFAVRNVYPPEKLHECDRPEGEETFILGQTALGTMKE